MATSLVQGADIRYRQSGDYFDTEASNGNGWQAPGIPGASDNARFNWGNNTVTLAGAAPTVATFQMGVDESGGLIVNAGGSLTATGNSRIGNNAGGGGANPTNGFLTINVGGTVTNNGTLTFGAAGNTQSVDGLSGVLTLNGGTFNLGNHLWVGASNNTLGTIDINSGGILNQSEGILGLGTVNAVSPSGGRGFINVNAGGILNLNNIDSSGGFGSIQDGSLLNISGDGLLTLPGDLSGAVNGYIGEGLILGNGLEGGAVASYDSDQDKTLVTVVPEPGVATSLLAFGLFGLLRRRRN